MPTHLARSNPARPPRLGQVDASDSKATHFAAKATVPARKVALFARMALNRVTVSTPLLSLAFWTVFA